MRRPLSLPGQWQREELGRGRRQVLTAGGQPGATGRRCLPALRRVTASPRRLFVLEAWSSGSSLGRAQVRERRAAGGAPAPGVQPSGTWRRASRVLRDAFSVCHAARGVTNASPAASGARPGATLREESGCSPAAGRLTTSALPAWASPLSPTGRSAGSRGSFGDSHPRGWLCVWGIRGTRGASKPPRRLLRRLPLTCYLCKAFAPTAQDLIHVNRGVTTRRSAYFLRVCVMENMRPVSSEAEVLTRQFYSSGNVYCTFLMFAFLKQK